jgi:hypothetical protein
MKVEAAIHAVPKTPNESKLLAVAPPLAGVASMTLAASDLELPISVC